MRQIQMTTAIALILAGLIPAYSQSQKTTSRTPQTAPARKREPFRMKKLLLTELPKDATGFVLGKRDPGDDNDVVTGDDLAALLPGRAAGATAAIFYAAMHDNDLYQFRLLSDKTVEIVSKSDGRVLESFSCRYLKESGEPGGSCSVKTYKRAVYCVANSGNGSCELSVTINRKTYPVAIY